MQVFYGKSKQCRNLIGECSSREECNLLIKNYINENKLYSTPYTRHWIHEDEVVIDFGSWTNYFFIKDEGIQHN